MKRKTHIFEWMRKLIMYFARHDNYFHIVFAVLLLVTVQRKTIADGTKHSFKLEHFFFQINFRFLACAKGKASRQKKSTSFPSVNDLVRFNAHSQYYLIIRFEAPRTVTATEKKHKKIWSLDRKK